MEPISFPKTRLNSHLRIACSTPAYVTIGNFTPIAFSAIIIISRLIPQKVVSGNLSDTMQGRRDYLQYLLWLQSDGKAKRQVHSSRLGRDWALNIKQFKEALVDPFLPVGQVGHLEGKDLAEANEIRWGRVLAKCMAVMEMESWDLSKPLKANRSGFSMGMIMTCVPLTFLCLASMLLTS